MEEALIKRILPHSIEAEQSVIGSMLMGREAIMAASEILTSDDFYQHQYGVIFDAMVELFNEGKPVDLVTLQNRLREKDGDQFDGVCPRSFKCGADFGECAPLCEHRQRESGAAPSH